MLQHAFHGHQVLIDNDVVKIRAGGLSDLGAEGQHGVYNVLQDLGRTPQPEPHAGQFKLLVLICDSLMPAALPGGSDLHVGILYVDGGAVSRKLPLFP